MIEISYSVVHGVLIFKNKELLMLNGKWLRDSMEYRYFMSAHYPVMSIYTAYKYESSYVNLFLTYLKNEGNLCVSNNG